MTGQGGDARVPLAAATAGHVTDPVDQPVPASGSSAARAGRQGGFSLIEILICVALVGSVILALAAGMLTLIKTNRVTSQRQQIQLALGSYTESLKASEYIACTAGLPVPTPAEYQANYSVWAPRWVPTKAAMTATITGVEYWNDSAAPTGGFAATCPVGGDASTQRLTVEVTWQGRTGTAQVVKSYRADVTP